LAHDHGDRDLSPPAAPMRRWLLLKLGFALDGLVAVLAAIPVFGYLLAWPGPGRLVDGATYRQRYEADVKWDGIPFFPVAHCKDMVGMPLVIAAVLGCAALLGPYGPHGVLDPTLSATVPRPHFSCLALFALFALLPPWTETAILLIGPILALNLCWAAIAVRTR
jgi:hypothetical protein